MNNKPKTNGKLEGEFRVPLSFGSGSVKSIWMCCIHCGRETYLREKTQGFICIECGNYNGNKKECIKKYNEKAIGGDVHNAKQVHILTEGAKNMINVRDTMQVKSDLYVQGVRRERIGGERYRRILNSKLKEYHIGKSSYKF